MWRKIVNASMQSGTTKLCDPDHSMHIVPALRRDASLARLVTKGVCYNP